MFGSDYMTTGRSDSTWTVAELTVYIRELFDLDYRLQDIRVEGEISNFSRARSGHLYFTLKDESAQLRCVMWRSAAERLGMELDEGDAIVARGHISVYGPQGSYQLYVEHITRAGRGNLALAFEELKRYLEKEGLFAQEHKKVLPRYPTKIGIVTSADAAALRDILNVLKRRYALASVLIAPTLVQGSEAPSQIIRALQWIDGRDDVDVIILARGGGSIEDLWAFNVETVARAVFEARHPVISGVGHETDFTIADFVADVRAPTPSAAAELAVPDSAELRAHLENLEARLFAYIERKIADGYLQIDALERNMRHLGPLMRLNNTMQLLDGLLYRLDNAMSRRLDRVKNRLTIADTRLATVGPQATLERGYAIVRKDDGSIVRHVVQVNPGERLQVRVSDGGFAVFADDDEQRL